MNPSLDPRQPRGPQDLRLATLCPSGLAGTDWLGSSLESAGSGGCPQVIALRSDRNQLPTPSAKTRLWVYFPAAFHAMARRLWTDDTVGSPLRGDNVGGGGVGPRHSRGDTLQFDLRGYRPGSRPNRTTDKRPATPGTASLIGRDMMRVA